MKTLELPLPRDTSTQVAGFFVEWFFKENVIQNYNNVKKLSIIILFKESMALYLTKLSSFLLLCFVTKLVKITSVVLENVKDLQTDTGRKVHLNIKLN